MLGLLSNINWYGTNTLILREIKRFLRVYHQTIIAPAVSALLFLAIFNLSLQQNNHLVGHVKFINFIGYGLIIMTIVQNAFANSSSSLIMSKVIGYISDILTPPLGGIELTIAFVIGSITRGITVGLVVTLFLYPFIDLQIQHPIYLIAFTVLASSLLGLLGIVSGIYSNSFDQHAAVTSYIITPLSFLSGTFYSVQNLPSILKRVNIFNPFFYMIDGFRYGITGYADSNIQIGLIILIFCNTILFIINAYLLEIGYRIKS